MVKLLSTGTPKLGPATPGYDAQPDPAKTPRAAKSPKQTPRKRAIEGEPSEEIAAKTPKGRKSKPLVPKKEGPESNSDTEIQQISIEVSQTEDSSQESPDYEVAESNEKSPNSSIEMMDTKVKIPAFGDDISQIPETKIVLFGLAEDTNEKDIEKEVSKHTEIVNIYFPMDKADKPRKNCVIVNVKTVADAEKLLSMNTLNVKDTLVHVLPHVKSKKFFDSDTNLFYRHPAGVFVLNLPGGIRRTQIQNDLSKIALVDYVYRTQCASFAAVIFEDAAVAQKLLQEKQIVIKDTVLPLHPIDGSYIPLNTRELGVGTTLYFSNLDDAEDARDLKMKVKNLMPLGCCVLKRCPLTDAFDHGIYIDVCNEANAKKLLDLQLMTANKKKVSIEMYDPTKHVVSVKSCTVCVESIDDNVTEIVLWKAFQTFGKISTTTVLDKVGYILFASKVAADQALAALNVTINGKELKVVQPDKGMWLQLRRKMPTLVFKPNTLEEKSRSKVSGKFKGLQQKSTFKRNTFKKKGRKTKRSYP